MYGELAALLPVPPAGPAPATGGPAASPESSTAAAAGPSGAR
jgi:hypothetical protein